MTMVRTEAQQFYDQHGYYEHQSHEPRLEGTYVAWARDFDNRPRHCDIVSRPEHELYGKRILRDTRFSSEPKFCTETHDPKLTGEVEWMRFIHEYGKLAGDGQRYFTTDGTLWINPVGLPTSDGRRMYAEAYFNQRPCDPAEMRAFSFRLKFVNFIANGQGKGRIECYDEKLLDLCHKAMLAVEASYESEKEVTA